MARIDRCLLPDAAPAREAAIYTAMLGVIHSAHCARKRAHNCSGEVTITRDHITMQCRLCGDARQLIASVRRE